MGLETRGGFGVGQEGICWAFGEDVTVSGLEAAEVPCVLSLREIWRIWGFLGVEGDQVSPQVAADPGSPGDVGGRGPQRIRGH